jgi:hypothetical protein
MPLIPRLHFFELNDQSFLPSFIRSRVQTCLTLLWVFRVPVLQPSSPAALVSSTLKRLLGPRIANFTFVDFCAGAGGPTPVIERELNRLLSTEGVGSTEGTLAPATGSGNDNGPRSSSRPGSGARTPKSPHGGLTNGASFAAVVKEGTEATPPSSSTAAESSGGPSSTTVAGVDFVLTDILPHRTAWAQASAESGHLHYISTPVDAANTSSSLLQDATLSPLASADTAQRMRRQKTFRLFFLAFHHMPDPAAKEILRNTLDTAEGFGVFELQGRSLGEFVMVCLIWPLLWVISPFYFYNDPVMLF